jgi:cytochrome c oxidase cbb3-type subunit 3
MTRRLLIAGLLAVSAVACEREERRYQELPAAAARPASTQVSALEPGLPMPEPPMSSPYQENAYGIAEGKRLYSAFNCNGCHAMGGGGIGPALMDDKWIYGSAPDQIYSSISQGRPDGMPTFGSRVPSQQIWQLVAYVQSLSVQVPRDVMSSRSDGLSARQPDLRLDRLDPRWTGHR